MPIYSNRSEEIDYGDESFWERMADSEKENREHVSKTICEIKKKANGTHPVSAYKPGYQVYSDDLYGKSCITPIDTEQDELLLSYEVGQSLLRHVKIWKKSGQKSFYRNFISNAIISHRSIGAPVPFTHCFLIIPQYSQLTTAQKRYYFYFRDCARKGIYVRSDLSYIFLYIYEIINLPDLIPPQEGIQLIWNLWGAYRAEFRSLDRFLSEWVMDYCLLYQLKVPTSNQELLGAGFRNAAVPEFYLQAGIEDESLENLAKALIAAASAYDYHKSRWYTPPFCDVFDNIIPKAVAASLRVMRDAKEELFDEDSLRSMHVVKEAFCGTICEHNIKKRIDIDFYSMAKISELQVLVTNLVKKAENLIRKSNHLSSVLKTVAVNANAERGMTEFFETYFPAKNREAEYERQYDAPETPLSKEDAKKIEEQSWKTTSLLVQEKADEEENSVKRPENEEKKQDLSSVLHRILEGRDFEAICREENRFPEELAAEINEAAMDRIEDVILENSIGKWTLIEDYREEVTQWSNM